jgi:hypothetical protein
MFKRILTGGIATLVLRKELTLKIDLMKAIPSSPQFLGLFNNLSNKVDILKKYKNSSSIALYNIAKSLVSLDYPNIFNKDKEKILPLLVMGTLIRKSFRLYPALCFYSLLKPTKYDNEVKVGYNLTRDFLELYLGKLTYWLTVQGNDFNKIKPFRNYTKHRIQLSEYDLDWEGINFLQGLKV